MSPVYKLCWYLTVMARLSQLSSIRFGKCRSFIFFFEKSRFSNRLCAMKLSSLIPFALLAGVIAQNPVEVCLSKPPQCQFRCHETNRIAEQVYQRWLMIIKPVARAGGAFNGDLTQDDIDQATFAFKDTWPRTFVTPELA